MQSKNYYVYITTNKTNHVLYTGVTNNLVKRIYEHKNKFVSSFTSKYKVDKLIYYEIFSDINEAISREKQIKAGSRTKKLKMIELMNPNLEDLYGKIV